MQVVVLVVSVGLFVVVCVVGGCFCGGPLGLGRRRLVGGAPLPIV